jgi:ketosteroid isomerase-like protein
MNHPIARPVARLSLAFALLMFSLSLPGLAEAQQSTDAEQQLRAAEAQLAAALSAVDVDQLSQLWAEDFVSTMADGRVTSGQKRLESLRARKPDAHVWAKRAGRWRLIAAHISEVKP